MNGTPIAFQFKRTGSQPSGKDPDENFTGTVRIDLLFQSNHGDDAHRQSGKAPGDGGAEHDSRLDSQMTALPLQSTPSGFARGWQIESSV